MRYVLRNTALTTALSTGLALIGIAASPAQAEPVPSTAAPTGLYPPSALVLAIGRGEDVATATVARAVTLNCAPTPSGTHPAPELACADLTSVDGDLAELTVAWSNSPCTKIWDPVTLTGDGVWEGKRISWTATYGNACEMNVGMARSSVFSF
ncbi:subtilase-type protease inhibitor [Streptomyces sp. NBC_01353]|uniref:subtilase-type protease inhibitor n=1 Tax=Streptomyces sp. NBC_01353 TaxID=2903835 RepID=UPI002E34E8AD|nr:subtilase-type protease inhibitor [Streptomyces sp. NBC_01353]